MVLCECLVCCSVLSKGPLSPNHVLAATSRLQSSEQLRDRAGSPDVVESRWVGEGTDQGQPWSIMHHCEAHCKARWHPELCLQEKHAPPSCFGRWWMKTVACGRRRLFCRWPSLLRLSKPTLVHAPSDKLEPHLQYTEMPSHPAYQTAAFVAGAGIF